MQVHVLLRMPRTDNKPGKVFMSLSLLQHLSLSHWLLFRSKGQLTSSPISGAYLFYHRIVHSVHTFFIIRVYLHLITKVLFNCSHACLIFVIVKEVVRQYINMAKRTSAFLLDPIIALVLRPVITNRSTNGSIKASLCLVFYTHHSLVLFRFYLCYECQILLKLAGWKELIIKDNYEIKRFLKLRFFKKIQFLEF